MSPSERSPEVPDFVPSDATLKAWEAQAYMLEYAHCDPESIQATNANVRANLAFEDMTRLSYPFLRASTFVRTAGDAEDTHTVLQDTYLRAYRFLPGFRGESQVETWLHSIMFSRLSTHYQRKSREKHTHLDAVEDPESFLGSLAISAEISPEQAVESSETFEHLLELLDELSPRSRTIVLLQGYYGHSQAKIAELLNTSEGAVRTAFSRARKLLRERHPEMIEE